jgi:hypothetical protein
MSFLRLIRSRLVIVWDLAGDVPSVVRLGLHSRTALIAENLFLRKQLAFYHEHQIRPRRLTNAARLWLVFWSRFFAWRPALLVVKPATLIGWQIGWHRGAFRLFWKWKSRPGRRHATFSSELNAAVASLGLEVIKTPIRTPQANGYCERLVGTIRRECLDFMIPLNERHLRRIVREWVSHYNRGRPHSSLGPGIPDSRSAPPPRAHRHCFEEAERVTSTPVLGGLHHEYALERTAA